MDYKEKILRWCGFEPFNDEYRGTGWIYPPVKYNIREAFSPLLDMNFFFKWVVPKLHEKGYEVTLFAESPSCGGVEFKKGHIQATQYVVDKLYEAHNPDIAQAWQEPLLKLIDAETRQAEVVEWQTRMAQDHVPSGVGVRLSSSVP